MDNDLRLFSFIFIPLQTILLTIIHHIISAKVLKIYKVKTKINKKNLQICPLHQQICPFIGKKTKSKGSPTTSNYLLGGAELAKEAR